MIAIGIFIGLELFVLICLLAAIYRAADESRRLAFLGEMRYARANIDKVMKAAREEKAQAAKAAKPAKK